MVQLLSQFGTLKVIVAASSMIDDLVLCPGVGEKKVKIIYDAFHKPFSTKQKRNKERKEDETKKRHSHEVSAALAVIPPLGYTEEPGERETGN